MSNAALVHILDHWAAPTGGDPDSALLGRFLAGRDEDAFAALVRRHGPLVYGTCRRVLGNGADADDAFQAVFFVLARRADALKRDRSIGPWLHGVALRIATKSRTRIVQRRLREMSAAKSLQAPAADPQHDFWAVIDEELARLPAALREVVVLCDLGGQSHAGAAQSLKLAKGTVTKRLSRAHEELASRLRRRGITLGAAALSAVIALPATASVPVPLLSATAKQAVAFSTGPVEGSTAAHALAEGVMKSFKVGAQKAWLCLGLLAVSLAGGGLLAGGPSEQPGAKKAEPPAAVRGASPATPGTPVERPKAKVKDETITLAESVSHVRWSGDGATMVSLTTSQPPGEDKSPLRRFRFWDGATGKLRHDLGDAEYPRYQSFELSPDGKLMGVAQRHRIEIGDTIELWDVGTGRLLRTVELDYGRSRLWFTFSPDSSTLAVCGADIQADKLVGTVRLYDTATGKLTSKFVPGKMPWSSRSRSPPTASGWPRAGRTPGLWSGTSPRRKR